MAMDPASKPHGAVARDSGMIAAAPRRNALRGMSEFDITPYNQRKTGDFASSRRDYRAKHNRDRCFSLNTSNP
jgi:hypothetical protein